MPNSGDPASRKCFSGVLSRLLCSGSLPTHPSEQLIESSSSIEKSGDQKEGNTTKQAVGTTAVVLSTPGVVARLMGLESFPATPRDRTLGAYFRSKSVNSIDFLSYFDPIKQGHHRRVRTSVSFRYHQGLNDDFTGVILHGTGENREDGEELFIRKLPEGKNREYFQASDGPGKNRENFQVSDRQGKKNRENFQDSGPGNLASQKKEIQKKVNLKLKERRPIIKEQNSKEKMVGPKCVKKKKKNLVNCSMKIHPEVIFPEVARSSRNHRPPQTANSQSPYSRISNSENMLIRENSIIAGEIETKMKKNNESCYYRRMVEEICMLSEENLKENWIHERVSKFEAFEEIIQQFGDEILEVMLNQFVDELVILSGKDKSSYETVSCTR